MTALRLSFESGHELMSTIGIIANPESGKDIRRLVGNAISIDNQQKLNIVKRILVAATEMGVERVWIMPEIFGFGERALEDLKNYPTVVNASRMLDMVPRNVPEDTTKAAELMRNADAKCIVVLGGDGTSRLAAKTSGEVSLLPISSGTNNVVPEFIEGTVAGLAAAYVAQHVGEDNVKENLCWRHKRLLVKVNGEVVDLALVDAAVVDIDFVGSKAVWEADLIKQIFVTRADPVNIGISSVIGMVQKVSPEEPRGAYVTMGGKIQRVQSTIVPGKLIPVGFDEIVEMKPGVEYDIIDIRPATIALDGERQVVVYDKDRVQIELQTDGPWLVDVKKTLEYAVAQKEYLTMLA